MEASLDRTQLAVLRAAYASLKHEKLLCDIFFQVGKDHYDLHKVVLYPFMADYVSAHSRVGSHPWFSGAGNTPKDRIVLEKFPGGKSAFEQTLSFCYLEKSFEITMENVSALFYCSSYFGMVGEGNLSTCVAEFVNGILLGNNHHKKAILFQNSVNFEQSNSLPCILSTMCMDRFLDLTIKNSASAKGLLSSFIRLVHFPSTFVECLFSLHSESASINAQRPSWFGLHHHHLHHTAKNEYSLQTNLNKIGFYEGLLNGLQLSRVAPELLRIILEDLDDHIFPCEGPSSFIGNIVTKNSNQNNPGSPECQWVNFFSRLNANFFSQKDANCSGGGSMFFYILGAVLQTLLGVMVKKSACSREKWDLKLVAAVMDGNPATAAGLLAAGACPNRLLPAHPNEVPALVGEGKVSALHCAAYAAALSAAPTNGKKDTTAEGRALATLALLTAAKGASVNAPSPSGKTCLHFAAGAGRGVPGGGGGGLSPRLLALLLAAGADVNAAAQVGDYYPTK